MVALVFPVAAPRAGIGEPDVTAQLKKLSLEQLLALEITTISRRAQRLESTPAAAVIITNEDIRRSGARSIPEALRLAPNLHMARTSASQWAISARGLNLSAANKLHVMIDGRSVYTPLFAGVFWDVQDTLLEDIERIEVISGPGGSLWGANAVNGVINIVTRHSRETQGTVVTAGGGNFERAFVGIRYGGRISESVHYRVYGKHFDRASTHLRGGGSGGNSWQMSQGGFRVDWDVSERDTFTVQGDAYGGDQNRRGARDTTLSGGNLIGRWTHQFSEEAEGQLQFYFDRTRRDIPGTFRETLHTYDVDWQHRFRAGERHHFVWGAGYRLIDDSVRNSPVLAFLPANLERHLFTAFVQDEIAIVHDVLNLTLGSKFEHNDDTGFEYQPSIRLGWRAHERHFLWAAISRAVRTPSRIDRDIVAPGAPPFVLVGGRGFASERLIAYELGHRVQAHETLSLSVALFLHDYDRVRSLEPGPPQVISNGLEGETYGVEFQGIWEAADWWRLRAGYSWVYKDIRLKGWSADVNLGGAESVYPEHQVFVRSSWNLPGNVELDMGGRWIDNLEHVSGGARGTVPAYAEVDVRIGWSPRPGVELALVGQSLLHSRHPEFGFPTPARQEIPRSVYGMITWRF